DAVDALHRLLRIVDDGVLHRARRDGEVHLDRDIVVLRDINGLDHADLGDRTADLGIFDGRQRGTDLGFSNRGHRVGSYPSSFRVLDAGWGSPGAGWGSTAGPRSSSYRRASMRSRTFVKSSSS